MCDRIAQTYYRILDCPACYFQADDPIIKDDFTVTNAEPAFFSQMPLADLREYTFEPLGSRNRFREYGDEEYLSVVDIQIVNFLRTSSKETPKYEILGEYGKWHNERQVYHQLWIRTRNTSLILVLEPHKISVCLWSL